jgi:hypothetical protein
MMDEKPKFEGVLALASAPRGSGGDVPPHPKLSRSSLVSLGNRLRAMYEHEMRDPLPPHLLELLNQKRSPEQPS